jgi:Trypsin-like peptidase domain
MRFSLPFSFCLALVVAGGAYGQNATNKEPIAFLLATPDSSAVPASIGSGFLVDSFGTIMTAKHVIESASNQVISVSISSKSAPPILIDNADIDCSDRQEFCFLRVNPDAPTVRAVKSFLKLGCYIPLEGEPLTAAGFFAGDEKITGVVTPRGHVIGDLITGGIIPTDIAAEAGMSGGPVFDSQGIVIGIVKGGSEQFSYVQPLRPAGSFLENRNIACLKAPEPKSTLVNSLATLGTGPDNQGNSAGSVENQRDHGSITCPEGHFLSGIHFYGAVESVKYCIGCFTGATAICRPILPQE